MFSAVRLLLKSWRVLFVLLLLWAGLLVAVYLFASTREATISQLVLTLVVIIAAPALFFVLQALSVTYAEGRGEKRLAIDCLRLVVVSLPILIVTLLAVYGLGKVQTHVTIVTTLRYLLIGVVAPMLTIQLWIATTKSGLRSLMKSLRSVVSKTFAPQSVFVYACGFLIFAVVPYLMVHIGPLIERPWLELSVLVVRLAASALLILLGWVTTIGAMSILARSK
jgi:hypothetical protein